MDDDIKTELVSLGHSRWSERDQQAVLTAVGEIERLENEVKHLRTKIIELNDDRNRLLGEVEAMRAAFHLAVGDLSTHAEYRHLSPDQLVQEFLKEARRG